MYIYFNEQGTPIEIINDNVARVGNENWNIIYAFWNNNANINNSYITYLLPDGTKTQSYSRSGTETKQIPFDKERDLKFFEYYKNYTFQKFIVPTSVLSMRGSVLFSIKYTTATENISMGNVTFKVDGSNRFLPDQHINLSEWNYLERQIGNMLTLLAGGISTEELTQDGTYTLKVSVVNGVKTIYWEADE